MVLKPPIPPMEARSVEEIPTGDGWQYEPKWDGFRCLAFRNGDKIFLQSKNGQPLARYFPDVAEAVARLPALGAHFHLMSCNCVCTLPRVALRNSPKRIRRYTSCLIFSRRVNDCT